MFYKIRNDILYRHYHGHGFITDNSEFGYQSLDDTRYHPGEKYVSESGAVMLSALCKKPRDIDDIISDLLKIFQGVGYDELKNDTIDFFQYLTDQGYLSMGKTSETCRDQELFVSSSKEEPDEKKVVFASENCTDAIINPNDFLRSIHFDITSICNERCVHCYIPHEYKTKAIDPELFFRVLEEGRKLNIIHVTLSGGEPLMHRDIINFLARCRELDLSVNVLSNLTLLSKDILFEMKKNPLLSVQTSLYSMDPLVHDSITGREGSFKKTLNGILQIRSIGIPVQISCPVMKQNKDRFLDVIHWGKEHNIAVAVEPIIFAVYDHSGNNLKNRISIQELEAVLDKELPEGYADVLKNASAMKESLTEKDPICSVCRYSFCVSVDGKVFPCAGWQTNVVGDLNCQSVQEIWESSEKIQQLKQIKRSNFPKCVTCEDRGYCTVCMMSNANENPDGNPFRINDFHCQATALVHRKVKDYYDTIVQTDKQQ